MLKKSLEKAMNEQIVAELYSSYLYLSMASYFQSKNLDGMANWMRVQVQEELSHGMKFYDYIIERGGRVKLGAIEQPENEWASPLAVFEAAYAHELLVTSRINALVDLAAKEKDHASANFLEWFVNEQVEEEASADAIVQKLRMFADAPQVLYMLDKELTTRVFTPPAAAGA
jgi:ferritin